MVGVQEQDLHINWSLLLLAVAARICLTIFEFDWSNANMSDGRNALNAIFASVPAVGTCPGKAILWSFSGTLLAAG